MITKKTLEAQIYAFEKHKNQQYDNPKNIPYTVHLYMVVTTIIKYLYLIPQENHEDVIMSGWLHDVREDQGASFNDVKDIIGVRAAEIVYRLTNNDGHNRKEKAIATYGPKTSTDRLAVFCKLADRLANVEYGTIFGGSMLFAQKKEFAYMVQILFVPGEYDDMWNDLAKKLEVISPVANPEVYTMEGKKFYDYAMKNQINEFAN